MKKSNGQNLPRQPFFWTIMDQVNYVIFKIYILWGGGGGGITQILKYSVTFGKSYCF